MDDRQFPAQFEPLNEVGRTQFCRTFLVTDTRDGADRHLVLFEPEISADAGFRAAFRKDLPILSALNHPHLLRPLEWSELDGRLYYVTDVPEGQTLSEISADGSKRTTEDCIDIGWQLASALQHLHNAGLVHGHPTTDSVRIADPLRIQLTDAGRHRWVRQTEDKTAADASLAELAREDLRGFGKIMDGLLTDADSGVSNGDRQHAELVSLISDLTSPGPDLLARDVQGRLGNLLLDAAGDSIEMIDHREGQQLSRRSIVDELFDDTDMTDFPSHKAAASPTTSDRSLIPLLIAALIIAVVVCLYSLLYN